MPAGKYERMPHMQTYGRTKELRPRVLELAAAGRSVLDIAMALDLDPRTVRRVKKGDGDWGNKSRQGKQG